MPDTQDLILDELRSLRSDFQAFARDTGERIATLETQIYPLIGNGSPGRVTRLETAVEMLSSWRWWVVGAAAGGSDVVSVIAWAVVELRK
jgi:hypothetical protein